jgi:hypothetical protein
MGVEQVDGRERHLVAKALALGIAAMDATSRAMRDESDLAGMQELLARLVVGKSERGLYATSALDVLAGILDRQAGRAEG